MGCKMQKEEGLEGRGRRAASGLRLDRAETAGLLVQDGRRGSAAAWMGRATALLGLGSVLYACSGRGALPRAALLQREPGRRTIRGVVVCLHTCIRVVYHELARSLSRACAPRWKPFFYRVYAPFVGNSEE